MSILDSATVLRIFRENDLDGYVEPSPREGKLRVAGMNNDVAGAVDRMGGVKKAAKLLTVSEDQVDEWIDNYFVPQPHADKINKITGHWLYSIQESTRYVTDGAGGYWPHVPDLNEYAAVHGSGMMYRWLR